MEYTAKRRKLKNILGVILTTACIKGCSQQSSYLNENSFDELKIIVNLILEDTKTNHYVIDWNDSLGVYENNTLVDKPYELHCYISDATGFIASHSSSSTSFTYCDFHTKDSIIDVVFILAPDFNSKKGRDMKSSFDKAWLNTYVEYEKIKIPVKRIKNLKVSLFKRSIESDIVVVKNNCTKNQVVVLEYWNKKRETKLVKNGQLLRLNMKTGDRMQLKDNALNYTHIANGKKSIYLCSNNIYR
jgi:hypothetical protein